MDAGDGSPQLVAGGGLDSPVGHQENGGGFDQGANFAADAQTEIFRRFPCDYRDQLVRFVQLEADLIVHLALAQPHDGSGELVAGAGFHRHALEQLAELLEIARAGVVHGRCQAIQCRLVFRFHGSVEGNDLASVVGQLGAATMASAGGAYHQGLVGQIVHGVDGVPGRLVGKGDCLCRLTD